MSATPAPQSQLRILVLPSAVTVAEPLLPALREHGDVRVVDGDVDVPAILRNQPYELVLAQPSDLTPLGGPEARLRAELILEQIGQGLCIVDRRGVLVWGNGQFRAYPQAVADTLRGQCAAACAELTIEQSRTGPAAQRRLLARVGQEYVFDLTVAPLVTVEHQVEQVVGLAFDITRATRLQEKINAIDAAGRELLRLHADAADRLDVSERLALIEGNISRFARELLHFDHYVVRVLDKKTNCLETVIASGLPEAAQSLRIMAEPEGQGITGYVATTGRSYICRDTSQDPRYLPGLERAGSSLTVPLLLHDEVVGTFNVESERVDAFTEDDRRFAEIFGRYIAVALNILNLLVIERSATTGQLAEDVAAELAAPLNDIIAEATQTLEDHLGQDDIRRHLRAIIDNVDRVKRSLQSLTETPGVRGLAPTATPRDPLLDGRRILIAEDEAVIRETIAEVFTRLGALTVMARDGQEAIAMVRAQHFDLVVSDIKMPYKNGYEVFAAAREAHVHCPVILITGFGYDPEHTIVRASKEGLAGVLFKPFKVEQLMEIVHQALGARARL